MKTLTQRRIVTREHVDATDRIIPSKLLAIVEKVLKILMKELCMRPSDLKRDGLRYLLHSINIRNKKDIHLGDSVEMAVNIWQFSENSLYLRAVYTSTSGEVLAEITWHKSIIAQDGQVQKIPKWMERALL